MFNAEMSAGSLMLPESRRVAALLLTHPSAQAWHLAMVQDNLLQKKPATAQRQATLIRKRLTCLDEPAWEAIVQSDNELAIQLLFAGAMRHSLLLAAFLRNVYRPAHQRMDRQLTAAWWEPFLADCAQHDPAVATWASSTRRKLYEVTVRIFVEAKYLDSSRNSHLNPPFLHPSLASHLRRLNTPELLHLMDLHS